MSTFQRALVGLIILALLMVAWMLRYELQPVTRDGAATAYLLDRWTGETRYLNRETIEASIVPQPSTDNGQADATASFEEFHGKLDDGLAPSTPSNVGLKSRADHFHSPQNQPTMPSMK